MIPPVMQNINTTPQGAAKPSHHDTIAHIRAAIAALPWATEVDSEYDTKQLGHLAVDTYPNGRFSNRHIRVYGYGVTETGNTPHTQIKIGATPEQVTEALERFHARLTKERDAREVARIARLQAEAEHKARQAAQRAEWVGELRKARGAQPDERLPEPARYRAIAEATLIDAGNTMSPMRVKLPDGFRSPARAAFLSDLDALLAKHGLTIL